MGNCCAVSSSMEWAGEDWGSLSTSKHKCSRMNSSKVFDEIHGMNLGNIEKERLLGALRASSDANGKVKIKISKKELAVLLGEKKNNQDDSRTRHASAEQVLVGLLNARDHVNHDGHHKQWKPMLQSIPELN